MYSYIKGELTHKAANYVVVEAAGVGYKIGVAANTISNIGDINDKVKIYTHLHVREDDMSLFGFATQEQLSMFEMLLTVSGVGPKVALAILDAVSPSRFSLAVITNDAKTLTQAQGVGLKVAQRIILELKDKVAKQQKEQLESDADILVNCECEDSDKMNEAICALTVLGYSVQQANQAVSNVFDESIDVEQIIVSALKYLAK